MPPKKKKSGKNKKSAKSGRAASSKPIEQLNELSKEFFLVQIRDLESRLARYQKKCDELEVKNGQFQEKFTQMDTDKREIVAFWKRQVDQRTDEIADLNDRLIGLRQAKDSEKEQYEMQLKQLKAEFDETKDQLTSENMILGGKLSALEEFKVQKEDLMSKFSQMEDELKKKDEEHKEVIYNLERKAVIDKDRLKKEMVLRVNQVAAEFRKVSNKQMAETTKRTIRENVSINAQLGKMSDKTMELIQENDDSKDKDKSSKQQIDLLEMNEKELAKKNHSNQKLIRMLTDKCRTQEAMIAEFEMREQDHQDLITESELTQQQISSQREEIESLAKDNETLEDTVDDIERSLEATQTDKLKLERVLADCATTIQAALTRTSPDDIEDALNEIEKRDKMLEHLLILLNSAAALGIGPEPGTMGKQFQTRERSASKVPGSGGIQRGQLPLSPISKAEGTLPHYQLGDLGLIPRPKQHIPTKMDKMAALSSTTKLGALRRVLTKSVGVQTVSVAKALFYADQLKKAPTTDVVMKEIKKEKRVPSPTAAQFIISPIRSRSSDKMPTIVR